MNYGLIVEDLRETREWIETSLNYAFPDIQLEKHDSVYDARQAILRQAYGIAVIDLGLPDGNGCDIIHTIKQHCPECYVVVATIYDDEPHLFSALRAGANGYLIKDLPQHIFINKLKGIISGDPPLSAGIARKLLQYFSTENIAMPSSPSEPSESTKLSPREIDVLTLVAKGYSRKEIARILNLSVNTVSRYIKGAYARLNISSKAEAAIEACRLGLVDTDNMH